MAPLRFAAAARGGAHRGGAQHTYIYSIRRKQRTTTELPMLRRILAATPLFCFDFALTCCRCDAPRRCPRPPRTASGRARRIGGSRPCRTRSAGPGSSGRRGHRQRCRRRGGGGGRGSARRAATSGFSFMGSTVGSFAGSSAAMGRHLKQRHRRTGGAGARDDTSPLESAAGCCRALTINAHVCAPS